VSSFFGIVGMTALFAAAAIPIMVMVGVLEAGKLVTCGWHGTGASRLFCCAHRSRLWCYCS
jgi:hypothetical protein